MTYVPPIENMMFLLEHVTGFRDLPEAEELDQETVEAILGEASKLASDVIAPLNKVGDEHGLKLKDDKSLSMPPGFKDAYNAYRDGGWNAVPFEEEYGGQGLPWSLSFPIQEMWQGANMAFGLCPLLNQGAVEAILSHGSDAQKELYLPNLVSGIWTGTMNLTEPQAGSDLAAVKTKAVPNEDGSYAVSGQKIFITYGEHDLAENIIHLVLARLPDAPEGVKGISLFIVPKFLVRDDGSLAQRNTLECIGIEHKLGIHASPTCTMQFDGATGYLVGEAHQGLKYMFTMMNNARLSVGLQGVAIAERAYQQAKYYAQDRVQGKDLGTGESCTIDQHPDVQHMLHTMQSLVLAGRVLCYQAAAYLDKAKAGDAEAQGYVEFLTPLVKSWCTDMSCEVASLGVQVHGGMGFIEETGAAQYYRDARILPIYEGTNGIQANDFLFRKILRDKGEFFTKWMKEVSVALNGNSYAADSIALLGKAAGLMQKITDMKELAFIVSPLLNACALLQGAVLLEKAKHEADKTRDGHMSSQADFYFKSVLPRAEAHLKAVNYHLGGP